MTGSASHPDVQLSADGKTLAVHVPMQFRGHGGRKVVIAPADAPRHASMPAWMKPQSGVDQALMKRLPQAFHFQRLLDGNHYSTVGDLARDKKLDPSFVARILQLMLLTPDLVEAILDGTQQPPCDGSRSYEASRSSGETKSRAGE